MTKPSTIAAAAASVVLGLLVFVAGYRAFWRSAGSSGRPDHAPIATAVDAEPHPGLLYGRVSTIDGLTYEGRLRWGGTQEACWGDFFNGGKKGNPWAEQLTPEQLPKERHAIEVFGFEFGQRETPINLYRLFMTRFGDIARIEARGQDVRVTLKSCTVFDLKRSDASDFDDGVRVWDKRQGMVDLNSLRVRLIELLPAPPGGPAPDRIYGTVHTRAGDFTGFIQWQNEQRLGTDVLHGNSAEGEVRLRFETVRAIARSGPEKSRITLFDGREIELAGTQDAGRNIRGIYVDDPRYGRVLVSWNAFERLEFHPEGSGPAYDDFPPGGPIAGSVTTRAGHRLTGRLVFDLDESEITDTLDAPSQGVNYIIPFGLVASIALPGAEARQAKVTLHSGETLQLNRAGDLGDTNAGLLVFTAANQRPEYIPWSEVARIHLDRPKAMYPNPTAAPPRAR